RADADRFCDLAEDEGAVVNPRRPGQASVSERRSGTHKHRPGFFERCLGLLSAQQYPSVGMGPCFRRDDEIVGYELFSAIPTAHSANAYAIATSSSRWKRPEAPPWPAPMLVRNKTGPPDVMVARSRAIHFAGSQ